MRIRTFSGWMAGAAPGRARAGIARAAGALTLALALLVDARSAQAQQPAPDFNEWEITAFAGYLGGGELEDPTDDSERDVDEDNNFGLIANLATDSWRHYEVLYSSTSTQVDGVTPFDLDIQYLQVGGIVSHPDAKRAIPYFGLTLGAARLEPDEPGLDEETKLAFSVAGGLRVPITEHFGVRLDLRAFITLLDSDGELFCVSSAGLTCRVRAKSDTFLQYAATLGVTVGF